ncbi:MAG: hypothetical protein A3F11_10040 [Gammaproteobacteria bacterium RIFCSPHIGHO2_12_FULL_37_14]|nr:MAG: hypothetical protein A3F11_10040 [Gammaproteobacteria bacterium RIFCSPHIGHO2_12_FULL_37_14]
MFIIAACTVQQTSTLPPSAQNISDKQQILNTLTVAVKKQHHVDVVFTVNYLKMRDHWAYIETTGGGDPGIKAVLRKINNKWIIAKPTYPCLPGCYDGNTACADGELTCKNTLHQQFPKAPISIFPSPDAKRMVFITND